MPTLRIDRVNGLEAAVPYFVKIDDRHDVTLTPHIYSNVLPMAEAQVRGLTGNGAWQAHGYATYSARVPVATTLQNQRDAFRGYFDATGRFQFGPQWNLALSVRLATDRTFLRRYDISFDDRLRSTFTLARHGETSYLSVQGWSIETLRINDAQGQQPIALPLIDYRKRHRRSAAWRHRSVSKRTRSRSPGRPVVRTPSACSRARNGTGGRITRFGSGNPPDSAWPRRRLPQQRCRLPRPCLSYRGGSPAGSRAPLRAGADRRQLAVCRGVCRLGNVRLTPRVQLVAISPVDNVNIPNEDSRAFELDDSNIFALNRFPGYDRFDDGARDHLWRRMRRSIVRVWRSPRQIAAKLSAEQIEPLLFPDGTGVG